VLLLFKLMFLSGATKLLSGDPTWRSLTALDYHFETQPLPTWLAWYAHQLPPGVHRLATATMFVVELAAPWLLLAPPRLRVLRLAGCAALVLFQLGIALTGNYGFFNLLAIVLCVPVLDDDFLRRVLPVKLSAGERPPAGRRVAVGLLAPVLLCLSALSFGAEIAYTLPGGRGAALLPRWAATVLGWVAPLRSFNGYGLFRVMTTERPEIVVEGSRDGTHWQAYEFRYKPGPVNRRPGFVAPYHPRLDWQMWFAGLDPMGNWDWRDAGSAGAAGPRSVRGDAAPRDPVRAVRLPLQHAGRTGADGCMVGARADRVPAAAVTGSPAALSGAPPRPPASPAPAPPAPRARTASGCMPHWRAAGCARARRRRYSPT
jgi:hypothetical protein